MAAFETESNSSSEEDSGDEADYGKSVQMLGSNLSSWGYILQSIRNCQKSGQVVDFVTIFSAAQQAFICEDFSNAIKLFAAAFNGNKTKDLSSPANENRSESRHLSLSSFKVYLLEMQNLIGTSISHCITLATHQDLQKFGNGATETEESDTDLKQAIDSILSGYAKFGLEDTMLLSQASAFFLSNKDYDLALDLSDRAIALDPSSVYAQEVHENICCHLVERWHFIMLNDKFRNGAYEKAIIKGIDQYPGSVTVCDVGCGTGLLSLIACNQLKCKFVYAIEKMKIMVDIARRVFVENLREENACKIKLINKISSKMSVPHDLPNHADILVTETFDAGLFGEGILPTLCHAWSKLLNQDEGIMHSLVVPSSAKLFVIAIESEAILSESRVTSETDLYSLNHSNVCICSTVGMCASDPYTTHDLKQLPGGYRALSEPCLFMEVDFNNPLKLSELDTGILRHFSMDVTRAGRLDALAMWFSLNLLDTEEISTHTDCHSCWEQAVFPVNPLKLKQRESSLNVASGDILRVSQLVRGAQHSLSVTAIDRTSCEGQELLSDRVPDDSENELFLASTLEWCKRQIYCLNSSEIASLNDTQLSHALCSHLHELLPLKTSCIQADFIHLNSGFSPLCLQALRMGYTRVWAIVNSSVQQVLIWKLAQENGIDISQLSLTQDAAESCHDILAGRTDSGDDHREPESICRSYKKENDDEADDDNDGDRCNAVGASDCKDEKKKSSTDHQELETQSEMCVVVLDVVDWQGRLLEDLIEKISSIRSCLSTYSEVCVVPHHIDVYGVLVESEELLTRSRVLSDEQTLGYKIASFVNKFSTRNHQGIVLQNLPHTKLCKPFRMFNLDLKKLLLGFKQPPGKRDCETETKGMQNSFNTHNEYQSQNTSSGLSIGNKTFSPASAISSNHTINECCKYKQEIGVSNHQSESKTSTTKAATPHSYRDTDNPQEGKSSIFNECQYADKHDRENRGGGDYACSDFDQSANITVTITAPGTVTALVYWFNFHLRDNKSNTTSSIMTQIPTNTTDAFFSVSNKIDANFSSPSNLPGHQHIGKTDFSGSPCHLNSRTAAHVTAASALTTHPDLTPATPISPPSDQKPPSSDATGSTIESCTLTAIDSLTYPTVPLELTKERVASSFSQQANSLLPEKNTSHNHYHMSNFASTSIVESSSSDSASSQTTISTLDPTHHWQQAAVMTDPSKERKSVLEGNQLDLHCVLGSSALSFWIKN